MTTKYDTNWIMKTAQLIFESTVKYNSRFTMEKALAIATERAQSLIEALAAPKCTIDEHDHITKVYDFKNVQSLDSIYGCRAYCGD
ncbi:hypothetical protein [Butyricimonas paravirosa]